MSASLRTIKGYYFAFFMASAMSAVYFTLYLKEECGLDERHIGILMMIGPVMGMATQPLWGLLADLTRRRALITALLVLAAGLTYPLLLIAAGFWAFFGLLLLHFLFHPATIPLSDSVAFEQLGPERRSQFGNMRAYGTLGFLVSLLVFGPLLERYGITWLFWIFAASLTAAAACMFRVGPDTQEHERGGMSAMKLLYTDRNMLFFLIAAFLGIMAILSPLAFLSIHARRLGADNTQVGWIWMIGVIPEVAVMLYAGKITRRIGVKALMVLGALAIALRWIPIAFMTQWWQLLPFQLLHGVAFGAVYVGAVTFTDIESPPRVRSSAQALFSMVAVQLSRAIGNPLCGEICQRWGYRTLFVFSGCTGLAACALMLVTVKEPRGER